MKARLLSAVAIVVLLTACPGPKRPPAVLTDPGRAGTTSTAPLGEGEQPVNTGPDLTPIAGEGLGSEEFAQSDPSGEGGPLEDIHFDYDKDELSDQARGILERHALWLQNHRQAKVVVEGHCDERGTVDYNLALGDRRARTTRDYLTSLGVGTERLEMVSYGKERPLDPASNEGAWSKNRRAHFMVRR